MPLWAQPATTREIDAEQERNDDFERDKLRKVVNDELRRYGLLIQRKVEVKTSGGWKTRANIHILYGQVENVKTNGWPVRPILQEGTFKECCERAAELLDALDAAQVPDTATGPNER